MTERTTSAEDQAQGRGDRGGHAPQRPTQPPGGSWWAAVKRTVREFQVDNLSDRAAALTSRGCGLVAVRRLGSG